MKPRFERLLAAYSSPKDLPMPALYQEIGWDDLINNGNYANTCAIRVNLALIKSGCRVGGGRMMIKKGPHKGTLIEPGQGKLSQLLARDKQFGQPQKFKGGALAEKGIGHRTGIISFFHLHAAEWGRDNQGHIDLVSPYTGGTLGCAGSCYWGSSEVWFWEVR